MANHIPRYFNKKIVNPDFMMTIMHGTKPHGEFKAFVRLAKPEKRPSYMKVTGLHGPGLFKVRIPCNEMGHVANDRNILSVELREHISCPVSTR